MTEKRKLTGHITFQEYNDVIDLVECLTNDVFTLTNEERKKAIVNIAKYEEDNISRWQIIIEIEKEADK